MGGLAWPGTFAEFVKVPALNVAKKPAHLDFFQAASVPLAFATAWRAVITQAALQPGETVLIQGVGGGVALFAMQIALKMGAHVIVTSGSTEKLRKAMELGASAGIDYKREDVVAKVNELTNGEGVHVSLSSAAAAVTTSIESACVGGRIVQFAYLGDTLSAFDIDKVMDKQLKLYGSADATYNEFMNAMHFVETMKLIPVISEILPLDRASVAFQQMRDSKQFGKIVLSIP